MRKGIILAGGRGTRLYPNTVSLSKHLLPVYDKPMIYYSLSTLMLAGIREILLICNQSDIELYKKLLGDGSQFGIKISYTIQYEPNGIAEALIIAETFLNKDSCALILGDNIFYGPSFQKILMDASKDHKSATIFSYSVNNPSEYGVVNLKKNKIQSLEEKPKKPKSNYAVTGLYFYDKDVVDIAKNITPSSRGELEITDVNNVYLSRNNLVVEEFGRGFAWLDMGTYDSLLDASQLIKTIEKQQGLKVACLEEIGYRNGWITFEQLLQAGEKLKNTNYGKYILKITKKY